MSTTDAMTSRSDSQLLYPLDLFGRRWWWHIRRLPQDGLHIAKRALVKHFRLGRTSAERQGIALTLSTKVQASLSSISTPVWLANLAQDIWKYLDMGQFEVIILIEPTRTDATPGRHAMGHSHSAFQERPRYFPCKTKRLQTGHRAAKRADWLATTQRPDSG